MGVVSGENSSVDPAVLLLSFWGVFGLFPFLTLPLLHLLTVLELSLLDMLGVLGGSGVTAPFVCVNELLAGVNRLLSSPAISDPSLAVVDSVGARPESRFDPSWCSLPVAGLLNAGWISIGGARGGTMVAGIGGFAGSVSSYRRDFRTSFEVDVEDGEAVAIFIRRPSSFSGAIIHCFVE
jgi:hypothetical protein